MRVRRSRRRDGSRFTPTSTITPLFEGGRLIGILVFAVEATEHARLSEQMIRVAEQHATAIEELQSTNEELETTNEELQSTNEELETTNEELQSTNQELETTVEELQAANTELAALNEELEARTAELNRIDTQHNGIINGLDAGIVIIDRNGIVRAWNRAAERMWLLPSEHALNRDFSTLRIPGDGIPRELLHNLLSGGPPQELQTVAHTGPGGQAGRAVLRLTSLQDGAGAVGGILAVVTRVETAQEAGGEGSE